MADGYLNKCIACTIHDVKNPKPEVRARRALYEQERFKRPKRKRQLAESVSRYRKRNPEKYKARQAVANALRSGHLKRGVCETCGGTDRVQAHHDDYSRPLAVRWLCFVCHRAGEHGHVVTKKNLFVMLTLNLSKHI